MGGQAWVAATAAAAIALAGAAGSAQECLAPLGSLEVAGVADLAVAGDLAYLAAGTQGLMVVDIVDATEPVVVGSFELPDPGQAAGIAVEGSTAYLAAGSAGLRIVDVSDPSVPVEVGAVTGGEVLDVAVREGVAYLAAGSDGLLIVDVSDPQAPAALGAYLFGHAGQVSLGGRYAFVAGGAGSCGSRIVDVSDPARPTAVTAPAVGEFNEAAVQGRYAYLARGCHPSEPRKQTSAGLAVVDLEAPGGPAPVGSLELPDDATGVEVSGELVFAASVTRVVAVDVGDPALPVVAWTYRPAVGSGELALGGGVVVVGGTGGIEALDLSGCAGGLASAYLLGAAHIDGDVGTRWRTDVEVCNLDPVERHAEIAFLERGRANLDPATAAVSLPPGTCTRYEDVVSSLLGMTGTAGAIRLTSAVSLPCSARTYNLAPEGSYGSFELGRPAAEAVRAGEVGALIQLSHSVSLSAGFRTNLELVNLIGVAVVVEVEAFSAGGTPLGSRAWELAAYEDLQLGKIFQLVEYPLDVPDGYLLVRTPTPGGAFLAAASVVDNLTGDGSGVPVMRR